ncbi:N-acetylmuramoyl-L-alanine amidase family protein [Streptococcus sp. IMAU 99125]|jgi:glucan-binding YG repeat protein|uniref:N-acetylmuramoyl-L-alanine amidase family protein n=1 Tax=Streptococcus humanilactis TaxID=2841061 RepID=A0ABS7DVG3_9STRE|nr:N-acetylmuramoyl-L-alanine amidase family protein [Streptococcus humanilactis]MBW7580134.1 N-acetylmuramoyl-L-alanine amidase family protein [Streptococcus humanilactis]MBW7581995.1 N-acetylmuramoyl-L-alanine amidase family protein [Streptococcus humanilactis]MDU6316624.1 N-acetylmuramoyl-L-alanine amidase family protein [Streptococcus mitis]
MKKITLFGLSLAGLALLAFPHSGQAFELKEEWVVKCGVQYQDGKILRFNNGHEVDIKVLDLPKTEKIEWTVSLDGQDQTVNFLGQEKDKSMMGIEGRYLNFYVPYGYRGDIKVEAKSGNEVKTWSTKVVDDIHNDSGKRGYYRIKESNDQYTYLDTKWDYQTKTYTATLPETVNGQKVFAWADYGNGELKLEKLKSISHKYDGGSFKELYPIVKAESWLKSNQNWYYQKQGQLVQKDWVYDKGTWYFMNDKGVMFNQTWLYQGSNWYAFKSSGAMIASDWLYDQGKWYYLSTSGAMKASTWVYDKGDWYYVSSSGAMLANDWVKDNGKWYYLASSGKMLRNTYTPDGYYVGNSGAWQ